MVEGGIFLVQVKSYTVFAENAANKRCIGAKLFSNNRNISKTITLLSAEPQNFCCCALDLSIVIICPKYADVFRSIVKGFGGYLKKLLSKCKKLFVILKLHAATRVNIWKDGNIQIVGG